MQTRVNCSHLRFYRPQTLDSVLSVLKQPAPEKLSKWHCLDSYIYYYLLFWTHEQKAAASKHWTKQDYDCKGVYKRVQVMRNGTAISLRRATRQF